MTTNYISEDYCSKEIRSLLEENGYIGTTNDYLDKDGLRVKEITLQSAIKWLREEHNIFIGVNTVIGSDKNWGYEVFIQKQEVPIPSKIQWDWFNTYEEACEVAIKYCLKNLIKNEDKEEESEIPVPKTVDEAISTLGKILSEEDREYFLENGAISMHDSLGRWIRNEWGLWTGSELKDELMNMNKGLNHPDDMSNYIIEEFIKYLNNKK